MGLKRLMLAAIFISAGKIAFADNNGTEWGKSPFVPLFQRGKTGGLLRIVSLILLMLPTASVCRADNGTEWGVMDDFTVWGTNGNFSDADVEIKGFTVFGDTWPFTPSVVTTGTGSVVIGGALEVGGTSYFNNVAISTGISSGLLNVKDLFIVNPGGNVGIGTTAPSGKLSVQGTGAYALFVSTDSSGSVGNMVVDNSGNVGIGTTNPGQKLEIAGGVKITGLYRGETYASTGYIGETGGDFRLVSHGPDANTIGTFGLTGRKSDATGGITVFLSDANGNTTISNSLYTVWSGNVGIGTTSPAVSLHVNGAGLVTGTLSVGSTGSSGGTEGTINFGGISGSVDGYQISNAAGGNYIKISANSTPSGYVVMSNTGGVGIGTTSPGAKLEVSDPLQTESTKGLVYINRNWATNQPALVVRQSGAGGNAGTLQGMLLDVEGTGLGKSFEIQNAGTPRVTVLNGGNVGIGTTSPGAVFDVLASTTTANAFKVRSGTSGNVYCLYVSTTGNVGIGTTAPGAMLEVNGGNIRLYPGQFIDTANRPLFGSDATGHGQTIVRSIDYDTGDGVQFQNFFGSPLLEILAAGNVGVGTTSPNWKLDVASGWVNSVSGYKTNGADYAEFFENEENIKTGSIVGININTGKARKYQAGDKYIGISTIGHGFIGNNSREKENNPNYTLVGLIGQLDFDRSQVRIDGRIVKTLDSKEIGILLSNNKVLTGR